MDETCHIGGIELGKSRSKHTAKPASADEEVKVRKKKKKKRTTESHKKKKQSSKTSKTTKKKKQSNTATKKVIGIVSSVLFYFVFFSILLSAILIKFSDKEANVFGYRLMTVLTDSMESPKESQFDDGFKQGSLIVLKNVDPYELKKDDIITFNPVRDNNKVYLTHRVFDIDETKKENKLDFITTKGDANDGPDVPIGASQVTGQVVLSVANLGLILSFLKNNILVVIVMIIALLGIVITLKRYKNIKD